MIALPTILEPTAEIKEEDGGESIVEEELELSGRNTSNNPLLWGDPVELFEKGSCFGNCLSTGPLPLARRVGKSASSGIWVDLLRSLRG